MRRTDTGSLVLLALAATSVISGCEGTGTSGQICSITASGTMFCSSTEVSGGNSLGNSGTTGGGSGGGGSGGGGSGAVASLTVSSFYGDWRSACTVSNQLSGGGAGSYYDDVGFYSTNRYEHIRLWYTGATCWVGGTNVLDVATRGTYTVGTTIVSGTLQSIQFTPVTHVTMEPHGATMVNYVSTTVCPTGPGPIVDGQSLSYYGIACAAFTFPSISQVIANVASITGTTLKMNAFPTTTVGPGVFLGTTVPTTAGLNLTKQ